MVQIEARIAPEGLAVVNRADKLQGRSLSDFVVDAAHQAAAIAMLISVSSPNSAIVPRIRFEILDWVTPSRPVSLNA